MSSKLTGDYRKYMDKNFLGSWDIPDGEDLILTIETVERNEVKNDRGSEQKLTLHFAEDYKPLIMNATNCDRIAETEAPAETEPEVVETEPEVVETEAEVVAPAETEAEVAAPAEPEAPQTFDLGIVAIAAAVLSLALSPLPCTERP